MANGVTGIFMVHSVMAAPMISKPKRDEQRSVNSKTKGKNDNKLFAAILEETTQQSEPAPTACQTTLYGRDSRLQNFQYLTREYHY